MKQMELAIVSLKKDAGEIYENQIRQFLGNNLKINLYSFEEGNLKFFKEKLILLSAYLKYDEIVKLSHYDAQIIVPKLTFEKNSIDMISKLEKDKIIYVYNLSKDMAIETISLIHRLGIDNINILPCYPEIEFTPTDAVILTPGEKILPKFKNCEVIDLKYRIIDLSCIVEIATKTKLKHLIKDDLIKKYVEKIIPTSYSTGELLLDANKFERQFDLLLSIIDDGIICTNNDGIIQFYNHMARKILSINANEMIDSFIGDCIKDINFQNILTNKTPFFEKLIKINHIDINLEIKHIQLNVFDGFILKMTKFSQLEKKQAKLRAQLVNSGNISKYTFDDILGSSIQTINTKKIANKMAQSNSSILIIGESGTGKELFAQSIHSASRRKDGPFVAVNCSTFQENLLQSELFGYDEGAFTGAKKGGKIGLFELANNGTIFLDEIGEMDLNSQSKLLRVIQEKQVRRIGSNNVIDIDVRIIAATNRNLKELVSKNMFRRDLYFRLNVLPLKIHPLRERPVDIFEIFDSLKYDIPCNFSLSEEVKEIFKMYKWEGNIRELRNLGEYFCYLGKDIIEICDLPEYILDTIDSNYSRTICNKVTDNIEKYQFSINKDKNFIKHDYNFKRSLDEYIFILDNLKKAYDLKERIGRKSLYKIALGENRFLTEQQIRNILLELQGFGLVDILVGRGGSIITSKGIEFLKKINRSNKLNS